MKAKFIWQDKQSAIEHFFRKGNLIALRELFALRRMADRVDSQVKEFRDSQGGTPVWHTTDSLMSLSWCSWKK